MMKQNCLKIKHYINTPRIKFVLLFGSIFLWAQINNFFPANLVFFIILVFGVLLTSKERNKEWEDQITHGDAGQKVLSFYGDELKYEETELDHILTRHLPFYGILNPPQKTIFRQRLHDFMQDKTFKIHARTGFREMPILVSATAIQISFGLSSYKLPQFAYIHIFPEEFLNTHQPDQFLEGNVSGQAIHISWKHFMEGFDFPDDGQNVGLHEMAHAYYYQNFISRDEVDNSFVSSFPNFNKTANKVFALEKIPGNDLFSDYALKNDQEFWAESIELFFEKPGALQDRYPDLYQSLCSLLNQDPVNKIPLLRRI